MTVKEIIVNNCTQNCENNWWPKYAYHYTDIENAIRIMELHRLFSRTRAVEKDLMQNDNANLNVITNTVDAVNYVRFYFRPLTPTQFRNEGFKHPDLQYHINNNANVPVPVFFLFDLCQMLESSKNIEFSEMGQAGRGSPRYTTIEDFSRFNFKMIYAKGRMENPKIEKKYRHAEILVPEQYDIDTCLTAIVCRSDSEKSTLYNLLRESSINTFEKYKDRITVMKSDEMFYKNGLAIDNCEYNGRDLVFSLMSTRAKTEYTLKENEQGKRLRKLDASVQIIWLLQDSSTIKQMADFQMDYENPTYYTIPDIEPPIEAKSISVKIWVEGKMMCYMIKYLLPAIM